MYSARRSTQSFVPEQNYTAWTFCLADAFMVSTTIMKKTTYTWFKYPEIQVKQTTMLYLYFFVLKKALCKYQFTCQYKLKRMEECFNLLVGLPHQCLLLSQDPMESGHHESSFEDQLHAVTNKKEQKLM